MASNQVEPKRYREVPTYDNPNTVILDSNDPVRSGLSRFNERNEHVPEPSTTSPHPDKIQYINNGNSLSVVLNPDRFSYLRVVAPNQEKYKRYKEVPTYVYPNTVILVPDDPVRSGSLRYNERNEHVPEQSTTSPHADKLHYNNNIGKPLSVVLNPDRFSYLREVAPYQEESKRYKGVPTYDNPNTVILVRNDPVRSGSSRYNERYEHVPEPSATSSHADKLHYNNNIANPLSVVQNPERFSYLRRAPSNQEESKRFKKVPTYEPSTTSPHADKLHYNNNISKNSPGYMDDPSANKLQNALRGLCSERRPINIKHYIKHTSPVKIKVINRTINDKLIKLEKSVHNSSASENPKESPEKSYPDPENGPVQIKRGDMDDRLTNRLRYLLRMFSKHLSRTTDKKTK